MKLNLKEFFKLSAIYTVVGAIPPILQVLVQPIIEGENRLNTVDFSHLAIVESIASFAFVFTLFSMGNAISRFYYDFQEKSLGYKKLVSSIFLSILFRGIVLLIAALFLKNYIGSFFNQEELKNFTSYGFAAIIIGINRSIIATAGALYRNERKVKLFVIINLLLTFLRTGLQIAGIFLYEMSFLGYVYGTVIGTSFTSITILIINFKRTGIKYDLKIMKEVNSFAFPLFQYNLIAWGILYIDRYFLEGMPNELGIYNAAITFAIGIQIILQGLTSAVQPELFSLMKEGIEKQKEEIKKLSNIFMLQAQGVTIFLMIPAIAFLLVFYETDLRLASSFIAIIFMRQILVSQYNILSTPVYFLKKTKVFFYINIFVLIINILLNYLLIPVLLIYGAIIASLVSCFLQVVLMFYMQKKLIDINFNKTKILLFPILILIFVIIMQVFQISFKLNPLLVAILINIFFVIGVYFLYKSEVKRLWGKYVINKFR